jgi:hypothetical protein
VNDSLPEESSVHWQSHRQRGGWMLVDRLTYKIGAQTGRRKPVKKLPANDGVPDDGARDSACPAPPWLRNSTRVSFEPIDTAKQWCAIRGYAMVAVQ